MFNKLEIQTVASNLTKHHKELNAIKLDIVNKLELLVQEIISEFRGLHKITWSISSLLDDGSQVSICGPSFKFRKDSVINIELSNKLDIPITAPFDVYSIDHCLRTGKTKNNEKLNLSQNALLFCFAARALINTLIFLSNILYEEYGDEKTFTVTRKKLYVC